LLRASIFLTAAARLSISGLSAASSLVSLASALVEGFTAMPAPALPWSNNLS
jgi:hypothetical protein